jgi:hypothetical protein
MKIDFELADFPWTANDTNVALLCTVESGREVEVEVSDDIGNEATSRKTKDVKISFADAVDTVNFTPLGECEFEWADTAEVMGNSTNVTTSESSTIQVVATSPASRRHCLVVCWQCGAQGINWVPSVGIAYEAGSGAITLSLIGVASLGYVVLVSMI